MNRSRRSAAKGKTTSRRRLPKDGGQKSPAKIGGEEEDGGPPQALSPNLPGGNPRVRSGIFIFLRRAYSRIDCDARSASGRIDPYSPSYPGRTSTRPRAYSDARYDLRRRDAQAPPPADRAGTENSLRPSATSFATSAFTFFDALPTRPSRRRRLPRAERGPKRHVPRSSTADAARSASSSTRCQTPIVNGRPQTGQRFPVVGFPRGRTRILQGRWPSRMVFSFLREKLDRLQKLNGRVRKYSEVHHYDGRSISKTFASRPGSLRNARQFETARRRGRTSANSSSGRTIIPSRPRGHASRLRRSTPIDCRIRTSIRVRKTKRPRMCRE